MDITKLTPGEKITILTTTLKERYDSIHKIRERVQSIGLYILGVLSGASGWLIQSDIAFSDFQKFVYVVVLIISFIVIRYYYLGDLERGFKSQFKVASDIEQRLGLFNENFSDGFTVSVHPKEWEHSGTRKGSGRFFETTYKLIYIGFAFLFLAIIFNGCVL